MPAAAPPRPRTSPGAPASRPPERATDDAGLVRLAAAGDDAAFEALFLRHRPAVHAYAVRMLGDHARAEDVVQDVFVSAVCALRAGTEPVHVRAWLREIARRTCIDQWRASTRRGEVSLDAPERLASGDERRLTDDDSLGRATEDRESVATLRRAFLDLPQLQHAVVVQRELEGRSPDEIAARLGVSRTVVEGQLARGRRTLARAYRELRSGERCVRARALGAASLDGGLGVRDRTRLAAHLRACDACRRHARELGVDARLLGGPVVATASLLLPLPLLRRLPVDGLLAGETASGALGAKVLVGAAVLAAGGGGVLVTRDPPPARAWPVPVSHRHHASAAADAGHAGPRVVVTLPGAAPGAGPRAGGLGAPQIAGGPVAAGAAGRRAGDVAAPAGATLVPRPRAGLADAPTAAPLVVAHPTAHAPGSAPASAGPASAAAPSDGRDAGRSGAPDRSPAGTGAGAAVPSTPDPGEPSPSVPPAAAVPAPGPAAPADDALLPPGTGSPDPAAAAPTPFAAPVPADPPAPSSFAAPGAADPPTPSGFAAPGAGGGPGSAPAGSASDAPPAADPAGGSS